MPKPRLSKRTHSVTGKRLTDAERRAFAVREDGWKGGLDWTTGRPLSRRQLREQAAKMARGSRDSAKNGRP